MLVAGRRFILSVYNRCTGSLVVTALVSKMVRRGSNLSQGGKVFTTYNRILGSPTPLTVSSAEGGIGVVLSTFPTYIMWPIVSVV